MFYRFEDCELDVAGRTLTRLGRTVSIEPLVFDLLVTLVRLRHRVVTGDELIQTVWQGRVIADSTLSSRIAALRHAISDDARRPRLVRTYARRGFRFIAELREETPPPPQVTASPLSARSASRPTRVGPRAPTLRGTDTTTIIVAPVMPASHGPSEGELAFGLTEDLMAALAHCPDLQVMSAGPTERAPHARLRLLGSLRSTASLVRVVARLTDTETGSILWCERFDTAGADALVIQDQLASAIAASLISFLAERGDGIRDEGAEVGSIVSEGVAQLHSWQREGIDGALACFRRSIALDPGHAPAYGLAAYCYVQRQSNGSIANWPAESAECERLARAAAGLATDAATLARAAHAIGVLAGDLDEAVALADRAVALSTQVDGSGRGLALYVCGWMALLSGRADRAAEFLAKAMRADPAHPLYFKMRAAFAYACFFAGQHDRGAAIAEAAAATQPGYVTALRAAAANHAAAGRTRAARAFVNTMRLSDPTLRGCDLARRIPFRRQGDLERWASALRDAGLPD
jgi:DNA-binding winged helix-turn-helix (wHTH) protein/tetratricopeptide (TPR) repeat protein